MCPGRTTSPFPRFNPKHFPRESLPFDDDPPCFFDANRARIPLNTSSYGFTLVVDALNPKVSTPRSTIDARARAETLARARASMNRVRAFARSRVRAIDGTRESTSEASTTRPRRSVATNARRTIVTRALSFDRIRRIHRSIDRRESIDRSIESNPSIDRIHRSIDRSIASNPSIDRRDRRVLVTDDEGGYVLSPYSTNARDGTGRPDDGTGHRRRSMPSRDSSSDPPMCDRPKRPSTSTSVVGRPSSSVV